MIRHIFCRHTVGLAFFITAFPCLDAGAQETGKTVVRYHVEAPAQTIRNFGASDAWSCQFAGNWPGAKKNAMADWLFSLDTFPDGSPRGIGLSCWRYNFGAGSAGQGDRSGIRDDWRRAASLNDTGLEARDRIRAQNWFLEAARKRGVPQFLGFFNSPPVTLTRNGRGFADHGISNISAARFDAFARYAVRAIRTLRQATGVAFDYISPVNEPQWDWSDGGQEGCPYDNAEISTLVKRFNARFSKDSIPSKILITESGDLKYLLESGDKPGRNNQVSDFFDPSSTDYVGDLSSVVRAIASHSYFSTSPGSYALSLRNRIKDRISQTGNLEYWQSEYCILGDNAGEINGSRRDTGMAAALYMAKVIYYDLVDANASAWQWWLAISPYDYKDGLIYIDKNHKDGHFRDSKKLWALGNYSRFVRPGMQRIPVEQSSPDLYVSGFRDPAGTAVVLVFVNVSGRPKPIRPEGGAFAEGDLLTTYTTDAVSDLKKARIRVDQCMVPAKSVMTIIIDRDKSGKH